MIKKVFLWIGIVLLCPVLLFIILTILLYIPPIQNWAVQRVVSYASDKTGKDISVDHVLLVFPLDLGVEGFKMIQQNDSLPQVRDTVADVKRLVVDIQLKPLFSKKIVINNLELNKTKLNTTDFIHSARIKGTFDRLYVSSKGIDLDKQTVDVNNAKLDNAKLNVEFSDTVPPDTSKTKTLWKIYVDKVNIANTDVTVHMPGDTLQVRAYLGKLFARDGVVDLEKELYTVAGLEWNEGWLKYDNNFEPRKKGLDYNHIALSNVNIAIDSIYYKDPDTKLNLRYLRLREKSGIEITQLEGDVKMDSTKIQLPSLKLRTPDSYIEARLVMDMNAMDDVNPGKIYLRLMASLGKQDLMRFCGDMPQQFIRNYPNRPLTVRGSVNGNMKRINFTGLDINLPTAFHLAANGFAANATDISRLRAAVKMKAQTNDLGFVTAMLDPAIMADYRIPSGISIDGDFKVNGSSYAADFVAREGSGNINVKGKLDTKAKSYQAMMSVRNLNIHHFMPHDSLYTFSGDVDVKGMGFDFFSKRSWLKANADVKSFKYGRININKVNANAQLKNGVAYAKISSDNELVDGTVLFNGLLDKRKIKATIITDVRKADVYRMRLVEKPLEAGVCAHVDIASDLKKYFKIQGFVNDLTISGTKKSYRPADITMDIMTNVDTTWVKINSGNLEMFMAARGGYEPLINRWQKVSDRMIKQMQDKIINQSELRNILPYMRLRLISGNENPFANFLRMKGIDFEDLSLDMNSSPVTGLHGDLHLYSLVADSVKLDTINFHITQDSTTQIRFNGQVQNNKDNPQFVFNALLDGYIFEKGAGLNIKYFDKEDKLGASFGARAEMGDSGINVHLAPYSPILGYKKFNLNEDNFIFLGRNNKISANVDLIADDGTGVKIDSEDEDPNLLQDLTFSLNKFDLDKVTSVMPYMPHISGQLNGDFRVVQDREKKLSMLSDLSIDNMVYENNPMGNLSSEFVYLQKEDNSHFVETRLSRNDTEIGVLKGTYKNEGDGYLDAVFNMKHFPLSMVNGFVPDEIIGVLGYSDGKVAIKGSLDNPQVDGELYLDSSYVQSVPYGVKLRLDNDPVRVVGSNLLLENFTMYSHNDNPLNIYGNVDFSNLERVMMDVKIRARNYQIIDSKKARNSVAYGKAFVNFGGNLSGELDNLQMRGQLDVLGNTNMTYILKDSPLNSDDQLKDLVTFTDFRDTTEVKVVRPSLGGLDMMLMMNIESGARIMCALNADQSNYVNLEGGGELRMVYNNVDNFQLFGRYTFTEGTMKYALPVIPLKTFTIQKGSYIEFTGDVMNPALNLTATEQTKSLVANASGSSRSVVFDCGVKVTKTLSNMGLEFTLDAPEDMTVKNELAAMSVDQRGKLAVTMLTTGMYLADGNTTDFSMNNALNSFLQSEINSITSNAMRTVDLSLGLDQTSDATGATHTDYSFKFAKRFWNNRFNLVIGGKISDAGSSTTTSNQDDMFIDNISLEYRLDQTAMRYIRLLYNKNADDLLEGRISEYGAGYVWRKKMNSLKELFDFRSKKKRELLPIRLDSIKPNENKK